MAGGAVFWTDFLYDDHGATGLPVGDLKVQAPPRGTYVYPAGPAAGNGADIFRVAIGLTETHTWWRIDWNTLVDATVPIALFTFDTDRGRAASAVWPAGGRGAVGGHRYGPAGFGSQCPADRPDHPGRDAGRAQRRPGGTVVSGSGLAVGAGTGRDVDSSAGRGVGRLGGRRLRRCAGGKGRAARSAECLQRRLPRPLRSSRTSTSGPMPPKPPP